MDIRKVQITGGSSFVITLPKEWARSQKLEKNDPLGFIIQPDGTLLLTPKVEGEQQLRTKEFDASEIKSPTYLMRLLISAYIAGHNTIEIRSKKRMSQKVRTVVRRYTQMTIGQEVVEETDRSITIKDLLNPAEMPPEKTIRRMHIIIRGMHEDVIMALRTGNKKLAEEVQMRDVEVNRLHWLTARQYNLLLRNVALSEKMGITVETATMYYLISRIMERIGDHAVRIGTNVQPLITKRVNPRIIDKIISAGAKALEVFNQSIESFFKGDPKGSNENIEAGKKLEKVYDEINALALKHKGVTAISVGYIAESLRRVGEYSANISENAINYTVREEGSLSPP